MWTFCSLILTPKSLLRYFTGSTKVRVVVYFCVSQVCFHQTDCLLLQPTETTSNSGSFSFSHSIHLSSSWRKQVHTRHGSIFSYPSTRNACVCKLHEMDYSWVMIPPILLLLRTTTALRMIQLKGMSAAFKCIM